MSRSTNAPQTSTDIELVDRDSVGLVVTDHFAKLCFTTEGIRPDGTRFTATEKQVPNIARWCWASVEKLPGVIDSVDSRYLQKLPGQVRAQNDLHELVRRANEEALRNPDRVMSEDLIKIDKQIADRSLDTIHVQKRHRFDTMLAANSARQQDPESPLPSVLQDTHEEQLSVDHDADFVNLSKVHAGELDISSRTGLCAGALHSLDDESRKAWHTAVYHAVNDPHIDEDFKLELENALWFGTVSAELSRNIEKICLSTLKEAGNTCHTLRSKGSPTTEHTNVISVTSKYLLKPPLNASNVSDKARFWLRYHGRKWRYTPKRWNFAKSLADSVLEQLQPMLESELISAEDRAEALCDAVEALVIRLVDPAKPSDFEQPDGLCPSQHDTVTVETVRCTGPPSPGISVWSKRKTYVPETNMDAATHFSLFHPRMQVHFEAGMRGEAEQTYVTIRPNGLDHEGYLSYCHEQGRQVAHIQFASGGVSQHEEYDVGPGSGDRTGASVQRTPSRIAHRDAD